MVHVSHFLLQVEDTLFKLPRCLFEESSEIFRDMFSLPIQEGIPYDGSSDDHPLVLEGVRKIDFRRLLLAMYLPAKFDLRHLTGKCTSENFGDLEEYEVYENESILCNEWASVLELSCMWQMSRVRDLAVKKILWLQSEVSKDDQVYLLRLSTELQIEDLRNTSIKYLSNALQPVELIQLGTELQAHPLLLNGYA